MKNMHKRQSKHCEGQSLKTYKKIIIALCVILFIFYIILFCSLSHAEQFTAKYRSCYDGDTCTVRLLGVPSFFGDSVKIRLAGIDTPEIRGKCLQEKRLALKARDYLNYILDKAKNIIVDINNRDAFGRYLASVYADNVDINDLMLVSGYARVEQKGYHDWCK